MGSLMEGSRDFSGLMYRRNRYLDPASGQFTQPDPIGLAGGLNVYGYADGDPVSYNDPYGLAATAIDGGDIEYPGDRTYLIKQVAAATRMSEADVTAAMQSERGLSIRAGTSIQVNENLTLTAAQGNVLRLSGDANVLSGSGFTYRASNLERIGTITGRVDRMQLVFGGERQPARLTMSGSAGRFGLSAAASGTMTFGNGIQRNPTSCRLRALRQNITDCN
jgi:RHS repeat-associated protein